MDATKISSILVPVSEQQLISKRIYSVFALAEREQAKVYLTEVIEDLTPLTKMQGEASSLDLLMFAERRSLDRLENIKLGILEEFPKLELETAVLSGKPFIRIIEFADTVKANIIALDSLHDSIKSDLSFGSTAKHLIRKSSVPVWAISHQQSQRLKNIVTCVDVTNDSEEANRLNIQILHHALKLARFYQAHLTVLHAWRLYGEGYLRAREWRTELDIALLARNEQSLRQNRLDKLVQSVNSSDCKVDVALLEGRPEAVIPEYVHLNNADLVVMGSVCRTGIPGFFIGNTAEYMLDTLNCSVFTIKPDDFRTPVIVSEGVKDES